MWEFEKMTYDADFFEAVENDPKEIVAYGLWEIVNRYMPYFPKIDYFCNAAEDKREIDGVKSITPLELLQMRQEIYILVCFNQDTSYFDEICRYFEKCGMNAKVCNLYDNRAFNFFRGDHRYRLSGSRDRLRVRIINYDEGGWILTKFADRLNTCLQSIGIDSDVGCTVDADADINHHISFHMYEPLGAYNDTLMITHIDTKQKIDLLAHQLKVAKMGICMSEETMNLLAANGIPRNKLCYINPAHDGKMPPKKYVLGITYKCHDGYDFRKRSNALIDIVENVDPRFFKIVIMGAGWDRIVDRLRHMGFEVDHYPEFEYDLYHQIMPTFDYYLYYGFDEGNMGWLDAMAAGVKTIVTPQGYHLDVKGGIDYACSTIEDFTNTLLDLQYEREKRIASVSEWTWENYAKKHVEVWNYLLRRQPLGDILKDQLWYRDGIFSCQIDDNRVS